MLVHQFDSDKNATIFDGKTNGLKIELCCSEAVHITMEYERYWGERYNNMRKCDGSCSENFLSRERRIPKGVEELIQKFLATGEVVAYHIGAYCPAG